MRLIPFKSISCLFILQAFLFTPSYSQDANCLKLFTQKPNCSCADTKINDWQATVKSFGVFELFPASRDYAIPFCDARSDGLTYYNEKGEELKLTVETVKHLFIAYPTTSQWRDETNFFKKYVPCITGETVYVDVALGDQRFIISIHPEIENTMYSDIAVGDFMQIQPARGSSARARFKVVLMDGSLPYTKTKSQKRYKEITLGTRAYKNVISYKRSKQRGQYYFWINKQEGIVAFKDAQGVMWFLKD